MGDPVKAGARYVVRRAFRDSFGLLGVGDRPESERSRTWTNLEALINLGMVSKVEDPPPAIPVVPVVAQPAPAPRKKREPKPEPAQKAEPVAGVESESFGG